MDDDKFSNRLPWTFAFLFIFLWLALYLAFVLPQSNQMPRPKSIKDEINFQGAFIAKRAEETLKALTALGPKVVGSAVNEVTTIEFLKTQIERAKWGSSNNYEWESDVQIASGNFTYKNIVFVYNAIQNVIVKLSPVEGGSGKYLLINSHFDTVPQSPGAADGGAMVAVMLEVLRVIAKSDKPPRHGLIFLFNGAEESNWLGSHAFISQHIWSRSCRAFINLDAVGSGGRLLLFQVSPKSAWIMRSYEMVPHPFASTFGEEIFQSGLILSNTDFQIFHNYGNLPGVDLAFINNGYVYHTKYDEVERLDIASLQNAGDNILTMVTSMASARHLGVENSSEDESSDVIFFDFLGLLLIVYSQSIGYCLNVLICFVAFISITVSLYEKSKALHLTYKTVVMYFRTIALVQLFAMILGAIFSILIAVLMDAIGCLLSWYSNKWLIGGLYFYPMFCGLIIVPALYVEYSKLQGLPLSFVIQFFMHGHCVWLILLTLACTVLGIRSSYLSMLSVLFYTIPLILTLHKDRGSGDSFWFVTPLFISQIVPFLYFASVTHTFFEVMVPVSARLGGGINPDLIMAIMAIFMSILFAGFLMPLFLIFRKTFVLALGFFAVTVICIFIALTPIGFPFRAQNSVQRFEMFHTSRIMRDNDQGVENHETGMRIEIQDRTIGSVQDFAELFVKNEMMIKLLKNSHSYYNNCFLNIWIPMLKIPPIPTKYPNLKLMNIRDEGRVKRFEFSLTGPHYMLMKFHLNHTKIVDWPFGKLAGDNAKIPTRIRIVSGKYLSPLNFYIGVETSNVSNARQSLEIAITGTWYAQPVKHISKVEKFIKNFPNYAFVNDALETSEKWSFEV